MAAPTPDVLIFRPRRLRVLAIVMSIALCTLVVIGWLALPEDLRESFTFSQRLTLLALLGVLELVMISIAASYVRADAAGLRFRNGLRTYAVGWGRVHKIVLRPGDPWGFVLLKPSDGTPFEVDLDAEKRQLMGIQGNDGEASREAVDALRRRHQQALGATAAD
jgi:hypothetical protein